jgi:CBS domain-containing protein
MPPDDASMMNAADVMTHSVITVTPETPVREIAKLMTEKNIGAVPVIDAHGTQVGIISESDLLRRKELGTERHRHPLAAFVASNLTLEEEYIRSHASKASDIMRRKVITAAPDTSLPDIVDLFEKHQITRVPIVENGQLVGIVARADLVRALGTTEPAAAPTHVSDRTIRHQLTTELSRHRWGRYSGNGVTVRHGIVHFWGIVESSAQCDALRVAAEAIPGVRGVRDHTALNPTPIA